MQVMMVIVKDSLPGVTQNQGYSTPDPAHRSICSDQQGSPKGPEMWWLGSGDS